MVFWCLINITFKQKNGIFRFSNNYSVGDPIHKEKTDFR